MVTAPADTPVTTPVELTVAMDVLLLLHVPPGVASASVVDDPMHTVLLPVMAAGPAVTVITLYTPPQAVE